MQHPYTTSTLVQAATYCMTELLVNTGYLMEDVVSALQDLPMVGAAFSIVSRIIQRAKDVQVGDLFRCMVY